MSKSVGRMKAVSEWLVNSGFLIREELGSCARVVIDIPCDGVVKVYKVGYADTKCFEAAIVLDAPELRFMEVQKRDTACEAFFNEVRATAEDRGVIEDMILGGKQPSGSDHE